ncbi:hypothetical protein E2562_024604 [Oryza meyeriana var. granulata]|uniref:Uncharacterized protein n=1 Tax=Oryza meyeriana var. granulata TaxID=110450 RepID=A0A6G1CGH8_9ORYZ|nr:hypothetical protein E2562_024063 [Oryza meyeriana var. granulata]KAF0913722.1 hypothetical protein E2562_024604 [Oryza meyeriana var. granulata]
MAGCSTSVAGYRLLADGWQMADEGAMGGGWMAAPMISSWLMKVRAMAMGSGWMEAPMIGANGG